MQIIKIGKTHTTH